MSWKKIPLATRLALDRTVWNQLTKDNRRTHQPRLASDDSHFTFAASNYRTAAAADTKRLTRLTAIASIERN